MMLISIELILLGCTMIFVISSNAFDDVIGMTYGVLIISIAGAESAIGLGLVVAYYRLRGSISISEIVYHIDFHSTSLITVHGSTWEEDRRYGVECDVSTIYINEYGNYNTDML